VVQQMPQRFCRDLEYFGIASGNGCKDRRAGVPVKCEISPVN
jgi:hypothetical protein